MRDRAASGTASGWYRSRADRSRRCAVVYRAADLLVSTITEPAGTSEADTIAVALLDGEPLGEHVPAAVRELQGTGEARSSFKSLALAHADGKRWLLVGLG